MMKICEICKREFDTREYQDASMNKMSICPDCYAELPDDEESEEDEFEDQEMIEDESDMDELDDYEVRLDAEENDE